VRFKATWLLILAVAVFGGALGIVGTRSSHRVSHRRTAQEEARRWLQQTEYTFTKVSLHQLTDYAQAAALVRVDRIDGPFWNTTDRRAWEGNRSVPARVYSRVYATVIEQWAGSPLPGQLSMLVIGDAAHLVDGEGVPPYSAVSGGFVLGEKSVLLLHRESFDFEAGAERAWTLVGEAQGNWRVVGETATSTLDGASTPVDALRRLLSR
jgi:hypothetical protein